jgi:splicing factor 3A subunit 1
VIIPPPDIKTVVDKTASYVAKNGQSFESMIMKVEANNPKFNFLRHNDDPYRPYYNFKLEEFTTGVTNTVAEPTPVVEKVEVQSILSAPVKRENEY